MTHPQHTAEVNRIKKSINKKKCKDDWFKNQGDTVKCYNTNFNEHKELICGNIS
jgi:hypothetical protein